jgi:hypothetical protein
MKHQLKWMFVVLAVSVALIATVFSAYATERGLARAGTLTQPAAGMHARSEGAPLAACSDMEPSDVAWVTLTEDYEIEEQVDFYESGVSMITPVFEYACVPSRVTIVTVFTLEGEAVFSDKEKLRASNSDGLYGYPLSTTDGSPLDEGVWGVEFSNNRTLLTSGEVMVGEAGPSAEGETVAVEGVITDKKTKKPIRGAIVLVLQPGVTVQDWVDNDQSEDEVFTGAKSDSKGLFTLENPLEREVEYSIVVVAKSYKPLAADGFIIGPDEEDPVQLDIQMTK